MQTIYNFSAGPAMLPEPVLLKAQQEFLNWNHSGVSMLELPHRSQEFIEHTEQITENFRRLLQIPPHYKILFLPGGGRSQFAMVPLNLLGSKKKVAYAVTGLWSELAQKEAERYAEVQLVEDASASHFTTIKDSSAWSIDPESAYFHYADNETVHGLEFDAIPESHGVPLVSDMSSNILTRPFDMNRFGLIYACAQKNMGAAGITVVVVREDLLGQALSMTPSMFNYQLHAKAASMQNTPPCFSWYILGLVLEWVIAEGGMAEMERRALQRSQKLYEFIDHSQLYLNPIDKRYRSRTNIVFDLKDPSLNERFVAEAKQAGLLYLKGHPVRGGMRVSLYNAMPDAGVESLIRFMHDFESK